MNKMEEKIVEKYFDAGYFIKFEVTSFVDSEVKAMYLNDNEVLVYDSEVFDERPVKEVNMWEVIIAKPIINLETDERPLEVTEPGYYAVITVDGEDV